MKTGKWRSHLPQLGMGLSRVSQPVSGKSGRVPLVVFFFFEHLYFWLLVQASFCYLLPYSIFLFLPTLTLSNKQPVTINKGHSYTSPVLHIVSFRWHQWRAVRTNFYKNIPFLFATRLDTEPVEGHFFGSRRLYSLKIFLPKDKNQLKSLSTGEEWKKRGWIWKPSLVP
jgi:hypothetical protein